MKARVNRRRIMRKDYIGVFLISLLLLSNVSYGSMCDEGQKIDEKKILSSERRVGVFEQVGNVVGNVVKLAEIVSLSERDVHRLQQNPMALLDLDTLDEVSLAIQKRLSQDDASSQLLNVSASLSKNLKGLSSSDLYKGLFAEQFKRFEKLRDILQKISLMSSKDLMIKEDEFDKNFDKFLKSPIEFEVKFDDETCECLSCCEGLINNTAIKETKKLVTVAEDSPAFDRCVGIINIILEWRERFLAATNDMKMSAYEQDKAPGLKELYKTSKEAFSVHVILSDTIYYRFSAPELRSRASFTFEDLAYAYSQILRKNLPNIVSSWLKGDEGANLDLLKLYLTNPKTTLSFEDFLIKNPEIMLSNRMLVDNPKDLWEKFFKRCKGFFARDGVYAVFFRNLKYEEEDTKSKITTFVKEGIKDFLRGEGVLSGLLHKN